MKIQFNLVLSGSAKNYYREQLQWKSCNPEGKGEAVKLLTSDWLINSSRAILLEGSHDRKELR